LICGDDRRALSSRSPGNIGFEPHDTRNVDRQRGEDAMKHAPSVVPRYHAVRFYESEESLAAMVASFLGDGLAAGQPAIVIAVPAHRAAIVRALTAMQYDVAGLERAGDLLLIDAQNTLDRFVSGGEVDEVQFQEVLCQTIRRAYGDRVDCTVRAYGEMVDILWKEGQHDTAIRVEMLWNQLASSESFSLLCGYTMGHFFKDVDVERVCGQHTHVMSADGSAEHRASSDMSRAAPGDART
jgi:hypothetical protein